MSDRYDVQALEIWSRHACGGNNAAMIDEYASALRSAATVAKNHVRLDDGREVRVEGDIQRLITLDNVLLIDPSPVFWWDGNVLLGGGANTETTLIFFDPNDQFVQFAPNCGVSGCYSTRKAAEAAKNVSDA